MNNKNLPKNGDECPSCGSEIIDWEASSLPPVAFKQHMYDACYLENNEVEYSVRQDKQSVILFHEEISMF